MRLPPARPAPPPVIWVLAGAMLAIELTFQAAEAGLIGAPDLRWRAYLRLAFFDGFFEGYQRGLPVPGTFWTSFLTHAFLHGSALHLVMNGVIFLALGGVIANAIGTVRFLTLFVVCAVAGALTFGFIADVRGPVPMVGASGVVFGLFGALKRWEWRWIRATGAPANRFWGTITALILMNVALFLFYPGEGAVAWEAHLGGFVAGWFLAPLLAPNRAGPSPI